MKRHIVMALVFVLLFPAGALAKVTEKAVWDPGEEVIQKIKEKCADEKDVTKCFAVKMKEEGASKQAIKFAKSLPTFGILRKLRETGRVDIAYVLYPFRANENYGVILVNGRPSKIDVDDQMLLPKDDIKMDPLYQKIDKKYHGFGLWPGDRFITNSPAVETPKGGGQWFAIDYIMTSGCRACEEVGVARFGFDFNTKGKFLGAKFIRLIKKP
jgi:hypothetical protein